MASVKQVFMILIELAVENLAAARAAEGGADRIELAPELSVGGLTPSVELTRSVSDNVSIPIVAMLRPRPGNFVYSASEIAEMCRSIERLGDLGMSGVAAGALTGDGLIDTAATRALVSASANMSFTFHRAFDSVVDQPTALEQLIELGVTRVLTSGGAPTALEGSAKLRSLVEQSSGRIAILAGGGIRESNVRDVVTRSGVSEVHTKLVDHVGEELSAARMRRFRAAAETS